MYWTKSKPVATKRNETCIGHKHFYILNVDFIISGDSDLLSLKEFQEIPVISASAYIEKVENS